MVRLLRRERPAEHVHDVLEAHQIVSPHAGPAVTGWLYICRCGHRWEDWRR